MIEIPGYIIKQEISSGPQASILLADQTSLDREVALKVMAAQHVADKAHAERFLQIARTLASFSHPNIVAVYDVGVAADRTPYFSMQYLGGGDFLARAQRGISEPDLTETLASIARALGYIHQRSLVHRSVTPQNVLYDAYNTPVLIDFGVAPTATQESYVTSAGFAVEAGRYMSPEQARGGELGPGSDIYSLGALCFLGLTGRPPYDGADGFAVAYAHVFEPIPRLPEAKAHWQALIDGALAKDPKDRFANVEEFLDALTRVGTETREATPAEPGFPAAADDSLALGAEVEAPTEPAIVAAPQVELPAASIPARNAKVEARAAIPTQAARPGWLRAWPVPVALLGVALIAVALLIPKSRPLEIRSESTPAATPSSSAQTSGAPGTPASTAEVALTASSGNNAATPAAGDDSTAPARGADVATNAAGTAPPAAADPIAAPDAAEAQADTEGADPTKAPGVVDPLGESIRLGRIDLAGQRLTSPPGANALERFQYALKLEPKSRSAHQGIVDIAKKYIDLADKNPPDKNAAPAMLAAYGDLLDRAADVAKLVPEGADALKDVAARRHKVAEPLLARGKSAADLWDKAAAKAAYEQALKIDSENATAREGLKFVATIGEPGFGFRDKLAGDAPAPPMVILPGGAISMSRHPVTRAEFRRFWDGGGRAQFAGKEPGCRDRESIFRSSKKRSWENPDIAQDDNHPVVCLSWPQAAAYAQWLGKQTGKRYRLPTPAEFDQLAARAPRADCTSANLADAAYNKQFDSRDGSNCDDGFAATSPVEHFAAVEGIYDVDGNVREWVAACGNGAAAAPGSSCRDFRVKGRCWISGAKETATFSDTYAADVGLNTVGFRIARDMSN